MAELASASDSSPADRTMAGTVYAVAKANNHPVASDIKAGRVKVDAMSSSNLQSAFGANTAAVYVSVAQRSGVKGDTIYVEETSDINDVYFQSMVVHELHHAKQDKDAGGGNVQFVSAIQMEEEAYRKQGRFILDDIVSKTGRDRQKALSDVASKVGPLVFLAMAVEAKANMGTYEQVMIDVAGAKNPPYPPATVRAFLSKSVQTLTQQLQTSIASSYGVTPTSKKPVDGHAGESLPDFFDRL